MNQKLDFCHLYAVINGDGDWQALTPGMELAKTAGRFFNERTGRECSIQDVGEATSERIKALSPSEGSGYGYVVTVENEDGLPDRWLGFFANALDAKRYYKLISPLVEKELYLSIEGTIVQHEPKEEE